MRFDGLGEFFSVALSASKDQAYREAARAMEEAWHDLIIAEADSRRQKSNVLIRALAKIDRELMHFKREYSRIAGKLTAEAQKQLEQYIRDAEQYRKDIIFEKNQLKGSKR